MPTPNGTSTRKKILDEALEIVTHDRYENYGPPEDNFQDIARFWEVYLRSCIQDGVVILETHNVADLMILMKVARNQFAPKWDNYVDICGYGACGAEAAHLSKEPT